MRQHSRQQAARGRQAAGWLGTKRKPTKEKRGDARSFGRSLTSGSGWSLARAAAARPRPLAASASELERRGDAGGSGSRGDGDGGEDDGRWRSYRGVSRRMARWGRKRKAAEEEEGGAVPGAGVCLGLFGALAAWRQKARGRGGFVGTRASP
jgi:hypothetical protein